MYEAMKENSRFNPDELYPVIKTGKKIALFLDYDGTLVPIRKDPSQCVLPVQVKKMLRKLAVSGHFYPVILSGRSLRDIRKMTGVRGICYGGNHGFDMAGPGVRYTHPAALKARPQIITAKRLLEKAVGGISGARLEDKKFSISLHYRSVREKDLPLIFKSFDEVSKPFVRKNILSVQRGKKVLELVPSAEWDKGFAALWLLQRLGEGFYPIYIGDDLTDETAFKALRKKGFTLKVGKSEKTSARYYVENTGDVKRLLGRIVNLS